MFLKLNEFETERVVRVNAGKIIFYKTIIARTRQAKDRDGYESVTATGIRFENDPIMLVVTDTVEQIDELLTQSYHYIK